MRAFFDGLLHNHVLLAAILSWVAAQLIKTVIFWVRNKKVSFERLWGAGDFPSAHTAAVVATAVSVGQTMGVASPVFGLAVVFAGVVIYDALGVRRQAGLHARVLNMMMKKDQHDITRYVPKKRKELKELLGHTPVEVASGAVLGVVMSLVVPWTR